MEAHSNQKLEQFPVFHVFVYQMVDHVVSTTWKKPTRPDLPARWRQSVDRSRGRRPRYATASWKESKHTEKTGWKGSNVSCFVACLGCKKIKQIAQAIGCEERIVPFQIFVIAQNTASWKNDRCLMSSGFRGSRDMSLSFVTQGMLYNIDFWKIGEPYF